jgi:hypothetical protein
MPSHRHPVWLAAVVVVLFATACRITTSETAAPAGYVPGLGEIMTLQQMRHSKLWFAGEGGNWALADYEVKELGEGFDDVVKYHPTHEDAPVAPRDAIPRIVTAPMADLQAAVAKKDRDVFEHAFDAVTDACNSCHRAMNFGFNVLQRPTSNPYTNQVFALAP